MLNSFFIIVEENDTQFIPQPRYILENILFDAIYEKLSTDFYQCALFMLGLQNAHDPLEWLEKGCDSNIMTFEVSSSAYKPFVVFEQGKENPYWDEKMVLRYNLRLLSRFGDEQLKIDGKMNGGVAVVGKGRDVLVKYMETYTQSKNGSNVPDGNYKLLSQSISNILL